MSLQVENIRPALDQEWDDIWQTCKYATYFHSREWAGIWRRYTKGKITPAPQFITFSDGKEVLLPVSLQKARLGLKKTCLSSPAGTYGGWLANSELDSGHVESLIEIMVGRYKRLVWRMNPFSPDAAQITPAMAVNDETHVLNLECGFEAVFKGWSKGHGSAAKKARREGVQVRLAETPNDWKAYYHAYENSLQRWGDKATSRYRAELFTYLSECDSNTVRLWLGIFDGQIICGCLCFYAANHVVYWHGASLESHFVLRPVQWILHEAIRDACERGFKWFDFNPSGGHEGVRAFKKSFGTLSLPASWLTN